MYHWFITNPELERYLDRGRRMRSQMFAKLWRHVLDQPYDRSGSLDKAELERSANCLTSFIHEEQKGQGLGQEQSGQQQGYQLAAEALRQEPFHYASATSAAKT